MGRCDSWPPFNGFRDAFQRDIKVLGDIFSRMLLPYLVIGEGPKDCVDCHEDRLCEDPSQFDGFARDLVSLHVNIVCGSVVALPCCSQRRPWDLRRWTEEEHNHCVIAADEPVQMILSACWWVTTEKCALTKLCSFRIQHRFPDLSLSTQSASPPFVGTTGLDHLSAADVSFDTVFCVFPTGAVAF